MKILRTLTIFDWDDTLYPTFTYLERDDIDYEILDEKIHSLLSLILEYGEIILITDASKSWVELCLQKLPSTKKLFDSKIIIITIRRTIEIHLDKELRYLDKGIKVLSLFFIDEVKKYRDYDQPDQKGIYAKMFEEIYNELIEMPKYKPLKEYTAGINYRLKGDALKLMINYVYYDNHAHQTGSKLLVGTQFIF